MMNKVKFAFLKSHLKKAIYELQVANKLKPNTVDKELIKQLQNTLTLIIAEQEKEEE